MLTSRPTKLGTSSRKLAHAFANPEAEVVVAVCPLL